MKHRNICQLCGTDKDVKKFKPLWYLCPECKKSCKKASDKINQEETKRIMREGCFSGSSIGHYRVRANTGRNDDNASGRMER